ncbi:uncharacterized protein I206_101687 [Kwoniella pini CBS 10737]|uniref:Vacuolar fusion protein MON1 n=1 Tax=Kwoniella pini CBS 10737 TaxID=1296096 RepID=A0A1B9HVZ8_9TREE|nr:vacuolar fusion protein MON1 [Kwoniella pini CBS 10737]OCF47444.1 vacuolar fusion protein MON1 [Kwoniella pini CBS 10737]
MPSSPPSSSYVELPSSSSNTQVITQSSGIPSFPPTPSRTTSKLSITSVDAHLSPPTETDRRRRSHSNPNIRAKSPTPSTPTKYSKRSQNGLLNVDPFSGAMTVRTKSSVSTAASSMKSVSVFDGVHTTPSPSSGDGTPTSGLSKNFDNLVIKQYDDSEVRASQSKKGKEKALDIDVMEEEGAEGEMSRSTSDVRKGLRNLVRRDTEQKHLDKTTGDQKMIPRQGLKDTKDDPHILNITQSSANHVIRYTARRYYVLTNAGKPVFSSHDDSSEDNITNLMAIASTLISIFQEDDDKIRSIVKGNSRIGFVLKSPLYLFAISDWGEPEHVLRSHLEYIHLQILSVVSSTQLSRVFQRRSNFDLTRLLEGTETFLHKLIDHSQFDFSYLTATLQPLRMNPATRDVAGAALMPPSKFKDLLYVLLIADGRIVTLLRPRKHAVHPSDLHLLLNTLASSATLRSSETWLPICFPKFNPAGFVHAYISYMTEDVGLVFVSADRDAFEDLRQWKSIVLEKLEVDRTLSKISDAIPLHPYTVSAIGCPGLLHFIYKSRQYIQITQPEWEAPYVEDSIDRKRLITLYQKLHDVVHARSGQSETYKLVYMRTEHEACLAWLTKPFELYLTVSPQLSKSAVVSTANTVAKWVLAEEGRVFLKDAPVF